MSGSADATFLIIIASAFALPVYGAGENIPPLRIPRVSRPPQLEDFLKGTAREAEVCVNDFRQYEPGDGTPASQATSACLSYDDKSLYIVFDCKDEVDKIRARMTRREDINSDDKVVVNLDTFHDHQRCYSFRANPLGVQLDGTFAEGQGNDDTFDTLWQSEGRLYDRGYIVWMAIPFRSLRFRPSGAQSWGIALGRSIRRNNEMSCWPYITQRTESFVSQFARLEGLERISPGRNIQFIPYLAAGHARYLDTAAPAGPAYRVETEVRAGLDTKMVLRDSLTFDVALNPDFSQVESDEPQVTVNQRFEVFFPEKRPFFIENAGVFETPIKLFFSRRIADPQFGARLTGKLGQWNLGAIAMDDRARESPPWSNDPHQGMRTGIGVVRIQREFKGQSSFGLLATHRAEEPGSNRVYAVDTRLKLSQNWTFSGQAARGETLQADGNSLTGTAARAEVRHDGRHLVYAGRYIDYSPDFQSKLGFVPRVDVRQIEHQVRYYWKPRDSRVLVIGPDLSTSVTWNRMGQVRDWIVDASFGSDVRGPVGMGCRRVEAFELYRDRGFRKHTTDCGVNSQRLRWLEVLADYSWGTAINYYPARGSSPALANSSGITFSFSFRPNRGLRYEQTYLYTRLGARADSAHAPAIFNDHVLRTKVNYQFTRPLSARVILDYHAVLPNGSLVSLERFKRLTSDILITFLLNPGTALYLGYTVSCENLPLRGLGQELQERLATPGTSTARLVFIKLSYLWRY